MVDREKVVKGLEATEIMLKQAVDRGGEMAVMGAFKCYNHVSDALTLLKEQEAERDAKVIDEMVKPTKCPCGELFDAKDSSFCPKCGCAYGELSGRYTNIGR